MPQQPNDNLDKLASTIYQPLQQQTQPTFEPQNRPVSGWGGKGVGLANIAVQFLGGVAKGRAIAYDRSLQDQHKQVAAVQSAIETIDQSDATEEVKSAERTRLMGLLGRMIQGSISDTGEGKSSKKSQVQDQWGQSLPDAPDRPHPVLAGVKGMLDSMLGPAPKKNSITPEVIQANIGQALSAVTNKDNSMRAVAEKLDAPVNSAYGALRQKLGHDPTFAEMEADQTMRDALARNAAGNQGRFSEAAGGLIQAAQAREKEKQALDLEQMKIDAQAKKEKQQEEERDQRQQNTFEHQETLLDKRLKDSQERLDKSLRAQEKRIAEQEAAREKRDADRLKTEHIARIDDRFEAELAALNRVSKLDPKKKAKLLDDLEQRHKDALNKVDGPKKSTPPPVDPAKQSSKVDPKSAGFDPKAFAQSLLDGITGGKPTAAPKPASTPTPTKKEDVDYDAIMKQYGQ